MKELLLTPMGKQQIEKLQKNLAKARNAFLYGYGWPYAFDESQYVEEMQIACDKGGEKEICKERKNWNTKVSEMQPGGGILVLQFNGTVFLSISHECSLRTLEYD